jgi:hypothetical protein
MRQAWHIEVLAGHARNNVLGQVYVPSRRIAVEIAEGWSRQVAICGSGRC